MSSISENLNRVRDKIAKAGGAGRVKLLAVSKTFSVEAITEAVDAGQLCFGENYAQEACAKVDWFASHYPSLPIEWHFIGALQSNKTRSVAERFDWIESLSRVKIAQRLNDQRPPEKGPVNVLVEVNIDDEENKSGVAVSDLKDFLSSISSLPRLRVRGLMCVPKAQASDEEKKAAFAQMRKLYQSCIDEGYSFDTLSMGMSADYELAIEEGSNLVRVGSAIFGARDYSKNRK